MGRVKTRPEIWPNPRPFWPTRPDPSHFFMNPSNPKKFFYQPENIFFHKCVQIQSKLTKKMRKNLTRAWPKHNFMNPNQNSLTRDPTRVTSHNPKPDPRAEKWTRPIPSNWYVLNYLIWKKRQIIIVVAWKNVAQNQILVINPVLNSTKQSMIIKWSMKLINSIPVRILN